MIEYRKGDIFLQKDINCLAHQSNTELTIWFGTSKGIAATIQTFVEAQVADGTTAHLSENQKVGRFSTAITKDRLTIYNCYSQRGPLKIRRHTDLDAIRKIFTQIEAELRELNIKVDISQQKILGIPKYYGCGLADGKWSEVLSIFESIFGQSPVKLVICEYNPKKK